jgi:glycosyltransferase involved in cell wall biosynthesis
MNFRRSFQVLARKTPEALRRFVKSIFLPGSFIRWLYPGPETRVPPLEDRLWDGLSDYAVGELEALKASWSATPREAASAAWSLACWFAAERNYTRARDNAVFTRIADPYTRWNVRGALLEAECLDKLNNRKAARELLTEVAERFPEDPDLCFAMANTFAPVAATSNPGDDDKRLFWINRIYEQARLSPLAKADAGRALAIDNLAGSTPRDAAIDQPKVTIIVPVYNGAATLPYALRSVLAQTWRNLEVIVVDDGSTDDTLAVANACAKVDVRVRVLCQPHNQGVYVARNHGLATATGEFVTTHDADDWSHPQRVELQVQALISEPLIVANATHWVRATSTLLFERRSRTGQFSYFNSSSIMFRREPVLKRLGYWDSVRFAGDTELWHRMRAAFGDQSTAELVKPLAFGRSDAASLTQATLTRYSGKKIGARKAYEHGYTHWHTRAVRSGNFRVAFPLNERPFAVPRRMLPNGSERSHYDVVIISDFRHLGGTTKSNVQEMIAQTKAGLKTAIVQIDRHDYPVDRPIHETVQELADRGDVDIVVYGDTISATLAIIRFPAIFGELNALLPKIDAKHLKVVVNQPPRRVVDEEPFYCVGRCRTNIEKYLGKSGDWVPIGPAVRRAFENDGLVHFLSDDYWFNIIDVDKWRVPRSKWVDRIPVIGRHGRDNFEKWPTDKKAILEAYPSSPSMRVRILGGANTPRKTLGKIPHRWEVLPFNAITPERFLSEIDFFVFFPHEGRIEAFGRTIMEAMASGCLVILPPVFEELFGKAACYCRPSDARAMVMRYYADRPAYERKIQVAEEFVRTHFGLEQHLGRIRNLVYRNVGRGGGSEDDGARAASMSGGDE